MLVTDGYNVLPKTVLDYKKIAMDFFHGETLKKVIEELDNYDNASEIALENKWHSLVMQYL